MSDGHFQRIAELFRQACALEGDDRESFLQELAAEDPALRAEIDALIAADEEGLGQFDEGRLGEVAALASTVLGVPAEQEAQVMPVEIDGYRIIEVLGKGAMGVVYKAEQPGTERIVAVKVLIGASMSMEMHRRFDREIEFLSGLNHVGIAQIYGAGMSEPGDTGVPYIAMEYLGDVMLNQYSEEECTTEEDRVAVLIKICEAVQEAHFKGVIHRDLKPSNIMVTEEGQPKILDFGVARAADTETNKSTLQTKTGQLIGTLLYMSPEQVDGDPGALDTRIDIYAIGCIAYEMFTGDPPINLDGTTIFEATRRIREVEPVRLDRKGHRFSVDLDTIIMKAIDKDRDRRYQSAGDLGADLERYLAGDPIEALRDSTWYVLRKRIRKHRVKISVAAGFLLVILLSVFLLQYQQGQQEQANRFLADQTLTLSRLRDEKGDEFVPPNDRLERIEEVDQFLVEHPGEASPETEADASAEVGWGYFSADLFQDAERHFRRELELRRNMEPSDSRLLALCLQRYGSALYWQDSYTQALPMFEEAVELRRGFSEDEPGLLSYSLRSSAACYRRLGDVTRAFPLYQEAYDIVKGEPDAERWIASAKSSLGLCEMHMGELQAGIVSFEDALHSAIAQYQQGRFQPMLLARAYRNLALALYEHGQLDQARKNVEAGVDLLREEDLATHDEMMKLHTLQAMIAWVRGEYVEAERLVELSRVGSGPDNREWRNELWRARVLLHNGRVDEAQESAVTTQRLLGTAYGENHPHIMLGDLIAAEVFLARGESQDAITLLEALREKQETVLHVKHHYHGAALALIGLAMMETGDLESGITPLDEAVTRLMESLQEDHWTIVNTQLDLAHGLMRLGRRDAAAGVLSSVEGSLARPDRPWLEKYRDRLRELRDLNGIDG